MGGVSAEIVHVPAADIIARAQEERAVRHWLTAPIDGGSGPAVRALHRPNAVVEIRGSRHVTITCLAEIAGLLQIAVEVSRPREIADPTCDQAVGAEVTCTVTRPDGVTVTEVGMASLGERTKKGEQRWTEWHAVASMAATRAKVRALTTLLMPILMVASRKDPRGAALSGTPAEIMPFGEEAQPEVVHGEEPEVLEPPVWDGRNPPVLQSKSATRALAEALAESYLEGDFHHAHPGLPSPDSRPEDLGSRAQEIADRVADLEGRDTPADQEPF